ncbi:MAG: acyl--CoA ligase [Lachnospiraceae bacterium]|nr:acyl--CoA ligase [Lachnospiraceae bacterium]
MTDRGIFDLSSKTKDTGYLSCFHLEKDNQYLPNTKKNLKLKEVLSEIEEKHNHSWYCEMRERIKNTGRMCALFYRGNKITFDEMMMNADKLSTALYNSGVRKGSEVATCMCNVPELAYVMLAINRIGAKMNSFSAGFNPEYVREIMAECDTSVLIVTDDTLLQIQELVKASHFSNIVLVKRTRSLPDNPAECDEYEKELEEYYSFPDLVLKCSDLGKSVITYDDFIEKYGTAVEISDDGNLDTDFLVSYTSGSTKIGFPKAIIHTNRSLIVSGRFHDAEVSGNPDLKGLRALAMIHPDSNTCLITCISDILMQGWCVAFEPEYNVNNALDYLIINKPNYANMTSSFWNEAARQYLVEKRFSNRKLGFLLAAFAVGENIGNGEEFFLNRFLKQSKAGSSVSIKGFHLPYVPISIGGGDCEHGGIYYTLWKTLYSRINFIRLRGKTIGMLPEKYVVVTALKDDNGRWTECKCNEIGVVVANSATTMRGYKNNPGETIKKIIKDENGREWISCNVIGYIDEVGGVHVKGRIEEFKLIGNEVVYPFKIDDIIDQDKKNILSSTTVFKKDGSIVANIIISPLSIESESTVLEGVKKRCKTSLSTSVFDKLNYKIFKNITEFPITGSGKRNIRALEEIDS